MKVAVIVFIALGAFLVWNGYRVAAYEAAMQDYEECMEERAGMTPSAFHAQHGYYPECY